MNKKNLLTLLLVLTFNAQANEEFDMIWHSISNRSLYLKSSKEMVLASEQNKTRMGNHWMPTLYTTGTSYLTNDPGANMFGLLSERSIEQSDFMPDKLNHPDSNLYTKLALGVNMPLYEGGMKTSISKASEYQYEAKKFEDKFNKTQLYSEVAKSYFTIKSIERFNSEIVKIKSTLDAIIGKYQLGNKSNMLGYSGLLGLRSLKNRILAITDENKAKHVALLKALGELNGDQIILNNKDDINYLSDINQYLTLEQAQYQESDKINALNQNAKAASEIVGAEKSRNLPRVGIFAESYAFKGDRKTSSGYTTGLTLNWNLFSGNDLGASDEALHNSHAAKYLAEASSQKEKIEFNSLTEMESVLIKTISTLSESQKLLDEQTIVANNLFKNGMINALQLTEVLSRRIDLLKSKNEVELNLVETKSKKILFTNKKSDI
jgi:outer membrane protein TolC